MGHLKSRLPQYPIDADGLVRTMTGESKAHIMLNTKAFRAVHDELDLSLRAMTASPPANPVDSALARLMDEARRALSR